VQAAALQIVLVADLQEDELSLAGLSPGCMVLSEFSGCSSVLTGAMRVNPFRLEEVTAELLHAATMTWEGRLRDTVGGLRML